MLRFSWKIHGQGKLLIKSLGLLPGIESPVFTIDQFGVNPRCPECEPGWLPGNSIRLNAEEMIIEHDRLFLYQPIPEMETGGEQKVFRVRLLDPDEKDLMPPAILRPTPRPDFPSPPQPVIQQVQFDQGFDEYSFEMDFHSLSTNATGFSSVETNTPEEDSRSAAPVVYRELAWSRIDRVRFVWPALVATVYQRFAEPGEPRYQNRTYKVNLYRIKLDGTHSETPLNKEPILQTVYLWEVKSYSSLPGPPPRLADSHPRLLPDHALFYIDLHHGKRDTEMFELRLIDRYGNESSPSPPALYSPPGITIAELSWGAQAISPAAY